MVAIPCTFHMRRVVFNKKRISRLFFNSKQYLICVHIFKAAKAPKLSLPSNDSPLVEERETKLSVSGGVFLISQTSPPAPALI